MSPLAPSPALSVVIPSHNRPDLLRLCLTRVSIHAPPGSEILVVDDGSPGKVVSVVARSFPGVRVVTLEKRSGFCVAANQGVQMAQHPIVQLLNDDVEVTTGWAEPALRAFVDPTVVAVAPLTLWGPPHDGTIPRIDSAGDMYFPGGVARKRGHGQLLRPSFLRAGPVPAASASSAFYRREAFLAVGGFPEEFGAYFEDVDLSLRLRRAGGVILYEPGSRVWHRVSSSYGSCSGNPEPQLLQQQSQNEERIFWRNVTFPGVLATVPLHAVVLLAKAWRRWQEGRLGPFVRGRMIALRELVHVRVPWSFPASRLKERRMAILTRVASNTTLPS